MTFFHGVRTSESPTSIIPPAPCEAAMPVYFGTAPVHRTDSLINKINYPILCNSYDDAVAALGFDRDWGKWTLCENIYAEFVLFAMKPCVFVNVFDPATHKTHVAAETLTFDADGTATLAHGDALLTSIVITDADNASIYNETDYSAAYDADFKCVITRAQDGALAAAAEASVAYDYADPSLVTKDDVIGGINVSTGGEEGLDVLERVYPVTRKIPGLIAATGWSDDAEVAAVMAAKAWNINTLFKALAVVDIPVSGSDAPIKYTDVPGYKAQKNLTDDLQHVLWPMLRLGGTEYR